MAREHKFDISLKNISSSHKLAIGAFPDEFTGSKQCQLDVQPDHILVKEEVPK